MLRFPLASFSLVVPLALSAAACSGGSGSVSEALIGRWVECDGGGSSYTFDADGTFVFDEPSGDHITGTYGGDDRTLLMTGENAGGTAVELELTYYASDTHFVQGASFPRGDHDGPVGTWEGFLRGESDGDLLGTETTLELREDGAGTLVQIPFDDSETFETEGTWAPDVDEENAGGYEFEFPFDGITVSLSFQIIDDAVLGSPDYCRE